MNCCLLSDHTVGHWLRISELSCVTLYINRTIRCLSHDYDILSPVSFLYKRRVSLRSSFGVQYLQICNITSGERRIVKHPFATAAITFSVFSLRCWYYRHDSFVFAVFPLPILDSDFSWDISLHTERLLYSPSCKIWVYRTFGFATAILM